MNINEILKDIKSNRVKKVIIDSDAANEMDDQYAIAYAIALDKAKKIELLSINAAPFGNGEDFPDTVRASYDEIIRVLKATETFGDYPVYEGSDGSITASNAPIDSPAAQSIIKTALESDELVYILALGACTNIASAVMLEPTIKNKICVIWLAGHSLEYGMINEYNWRQDVGASEFLFNCGVKMVLLPARGGTGEMKFRLPMIRRYLTRDSVACKFFRDEFPANFAGKAAKEPDGEFMGDHWVRQISDIAAPALFEIHECFDLEIIPTPLWDDEFRYVIDKSRHPMIIMNKLEPDPVMIDALMKINTL